MFFEIILNTTYLNAASAEEPITMNMKRTEWQNLEDVRPLLEAFGDTTRKIQECIKHILLTNNQNKKNFFAENYESLVFVLGSIRDTLELSSNLGPGNWTDETNIMEVLMKRDLGGKMLSEKVRNLSLTISSRALRGSNISLRQVPKLDSWGEEDTMTRLDTLLGNLLDIAQKIDEKLPPRE